MKTKVQQREEWRLKQQARLAAMTPEQRKELFAKNSARRSEKRAAVALLNGRTPGKCGPRKFSDVEFVESRKKVYEKFNNTHRERRREYQRQWKEELRETPEGRKYLQEIAVVHGAQRRAQKAKSKGSHTRADIRELFFEQKGCCALCDLPFAHEKDFHVDHWKPLSKGGSNDKSNLKLLHPKCNLSKGAKLPEEFNKRSA